MRVSPRARLLDCIPPSTPLHHADEDESFQAALNIDNAVAATGWYGQGGTKLWCTTGTETLHLWEWQAACNEEGGGEKPGWWAPDSAVVWCLDGWCSQHIGAKVFVPFLSVPARQLPPETLCGTRV